MSEHIVVGSDRYITVPESLQKIGVQFDHNAETVTFDCPRYWDEHDLSKMKIYINYMRPNDSFGAYLCSDAEIDSMDNTIMHFNWVISGHVTEFAGPLSFLVCICDVDQNGDSTTHWNSELNTQLYISSGMKCRDAILGRYPDIITQLLNRMDSVEAVFAPTVEITEIEGGHHLKMIDVNGTYEFDVMDGNKGDKGDAFTYSDFTAEQLAALKGEKGDAFTYSDFTAEQLAALKGEKGDTGSGLRILGYYETLTALESSVTNPSVGDAYGVGSSEPYNIYIYTGINGWVNNGALQGAKGEDGHTPEKGIDYFTDADKQEIATAASEMIGQATDTKQGLVMVNGENGIGVNTEDGSLYIKSATEAEIDGKSHSYNSIVPNNLNYAVKAGLTSNSITLTEAEKTSALNWIGAIASSDKGKAGGVATLDSSGKVPSGQIPSLEYAEKTHASQHASGGSDPITPADIGAMPSMKRTFIYDGINSTKKLTTAGWYRILKHNMPDDKAFLINIGHEYSDTGPENVLFFVCSKLSCPSIVVLSHSNNPSRPTIIFYKKIRITKDSNYTYIDFYRAQDGDECIPRVSIIEFITDATVVQNKKSEPLDVLPVDEAPDGETILLMQNVSVIPSGNVLTDANKAKSVAVTLTASGWDSSAKTQTVTVSGVLADETKQLITPTPALASQAAYYEAVVLCTGQAADQLTFTAKKIPTDDLTVYVTIQEVGA